MGDICVPEWFQGPTGSGQGGWTAHRFGQAIGQPVTVAIRAPVPLKRELIVMDTADGWSLVDPAAPDAPIMLAEPWTPDVPDTDPVSIADAAIAGMRFPLFDDHPVPHCFSCGIQHDSMQVHGGPLRDGRYAADWTVPYWAERDDGSIDEAVVWAAIDCMQAWYAGLAGGRRHGVTVQIAVDVVRPVLPRATYALVAWPGDYDHEWDGRKRGACGIVFDSTGRVVARSRTFWVAIDPPEAASTESSG